MNDERKKEVLTWMYRELGHKWFGPAVLCPIRNKSGKPPCSLSITEIHSVFETLRKEEYIFPVINQHGQPCFVLNEMKESEWIEKIENTAPTKEKIVGDMIQSGISYILQQFGVGFTGGIVAFILSYIFSK